MEKQKISFIDLVNVLSQKEMKKVTGGCGGGYTITCGLNSGACWKCTFICKGEFTGWCSVATGNPNDYCSDWRCDQI